MAATAFCEAEDCIRPTHNRSRFCSGHAKRFELGQTVNAPLREKLSLRERVAQLCINLAEADSEDDAAWERAWDALEHALRSWGDSIRGRRGGLMSALALSAKERRERAKKAAAARWWNGVLTGKHPRKGRAKQTGKGSRRARGRP